MEHATQRLTSVVGDMSGSAMRLRYEGIPSQQTSSLVLLVAKVVDTALSYLWEGGVLVPTVLTTHSQALMLQNGGDGTATPPELRLFGDPMSIETDLDLGLRRSRRFVDALSPTEVNSYVWAYDGFVDSRGNEAVIIEAGEAGSPHGWRLCVRYRFSKSGISQLDSEAHVLEAVYLPFCSR